MQAPKCRGGMRRRNVLALSATAERLYVAEQTPRCTNPPMQPAPAHVLVVDDDAAVCALVKEYLSQNDFRVTTVATGKQMMEVLAAEAIDLVVLDLGLRGEDGLRHAQRLREDSKIPIIIVTGRLDEADRVMGLELGADDLRLRNLSARANCSREFAPSYAVTMQWNHCPVAMKGCAPIVSPAGS